ncbi:fimbrial protein [Edwardsiella tarda]|uniref:Fimbrial protein n=1 Tax=Edwardsiella tarda ATCC 15947 = NBRC 105688 TaxID=667121 RepID=A0AC61TMW1_EDWTA|nr:fimbrial protein [Edwardsiella tarda]UAL58110.1 fimbrial protein [Edwardsiella tarda]UCQ02029.1 fimbrial protein [Edwardsiella tarda ATCC 15947 = NBRC 105688]
MKKVTLFLFAFSLQPSCVLAWNTPGENFSGELKLEGPVTNTRNPWVWKVGPGNERLEVKPKGDTHNKAQRMPVSLPAMTILLGKTTLTTPTRHEGCSPKVIYGKEVEDFSLTWLGTGIAEVTLPVSGNNSLRVGTFVFRMQVAAVLRHRQDGQDIYASVHNDLNTNGLPGEGRTMQAGNVPSVLQMMFNGEGPNWLQDMVVTDTIGLSRYNDASLRQVEGVYGTQIVADSGELRLFGAVPDRWLASLPISIEYQ